MSTATQPIAAVVLRSDWKDVTIDFNRHFMLSWNFDVDLKS